MKIGDLVQLKGNWDDLGSADITGIVCLIKPDSYGDTDWDLYKIQWMDGVKSTEIFKELKVISEGA